MPQYTFKGYRGTGEDHGPFTYRSDKVALSFGFAYMYDSVVRHDTVFTETEIYTKPKPEFRVFFTDKSGRLHQYSDTKFKTRDEAERYIEDRRSFLTADLLDEREPFVVLEVPGN